MAPKKGPPHAAFCEEYDEDAHAIIPETRQVANVAARRSRSDLRSLAEPLVDLASDSGYSSRTAATVHSTQSAPSSGRNDFSSSAAPSAAAAALKRVDLDRVARSSRKDRTKDRNPRPSRENDKMQVVYPPVSHHHHHPQQHQHQLPPSHPPSRRRDSAQLRHQPGTCLECDQGLYHGSLDYSPGYYISQPSTPSVHDFPPSVIQQDVPISRPSARSGRSNSYHTNSRPVSFHGMAPNPMGGPVMYHSGSVARYDRGGPPLSSSAYANYAASQYSQPGSYYGAPEYITHDRRKERSASRSRPRRPSLSVYPQAPPMPDFDMPPVTFDDDDEDEDDEEEEEEEPLDLAPPPPPAPPQPRPRQPSYSAHDENYYRMPPPPLKQPHIIQRRPDPPRKSATTPVVPSDRRSSRSLDLADLRDALPPEYGYYRSSRETIVPERNRSLRSATYHDRNATRPSRVSVESARRRRNPTVYDDYPASVSVGGSASGSAPAPADDIEEKQREAEEYQYQAASRAGKPPPPPAVLPLTEDALYKAKTARPGSESGSQKSRSSRGSAKPDDNNAVAAAPNNNNIVMTMNGVTMSFPQDAVGGKMISVRSRDTGAISLNIHGPNEHRRRPKKYLPAGSASGASEHSGSMARREIEDAHRPRGDRRSERASRRSSRSIYSGRS